MKYLTEQNRKYIDSYIETGDHKIAAREAGLNKVPPASFWEYDIVVNYKNEREALYEQKTKEQFDDITEAEIIHRLIGISKKAEDDSKYGDAIKALHEISDLKKFFKDDPRLDIEIPEDDEIEDRLEHIKRAVESS